MPRQSEQQLTGREGERWFQSQLPNGWVLQRPTEDIGLDGVVVISDGSQYDGLEFRVQVKSSQHWNENESGILVKNLNRESVLYWLTGLTPTLLILYCNRTKSAHWYWANRLFADRRELLAGATHAIQARIPADNPLTKDSWGNIANDIAAIQSSIAETFNTAHGSRVVFQLLHSMHSALQGIYYATAKLKDGRTISPEGERLSDHLELISYRDFILALREFAARMRADSSGYAWFTALADGYQSRCAEFVRPIEALLTSSDEHGISAELCREDMLANREALMGAIIDTLHTITKARITYDTKHSKPEA